MGLLSMLCNVVSNAAACLAHSLARLKSNATGNWRDAGRDG